MKRFVILATAVGLAAWPVVGHADDPGTQGQPSQSCQDVFPSGALTPAGFNTDGFAHAETVYAGSQAVNSNNPASVSQYDVACFQAGQH